jgi:hypothetical protein
LRVRRGRSGSLVALDVPAGLRTPVTRLTAHQKNSVTFLRAQSHGCEFADKSARSTETVGRRGGYVAPDAGRQTPLTTRCNSPAANAPTGAALPVASGGRILNELL